ncbi:MAG TPA: L-2-hydroxyglutarate oxidase [Candidatus Koribacter sp.]|jgi:L-2-hydroxyglutarate oxidase LhgO
MNNHDISEVNPESSCDVLIVGAGIVGLALALELTQRYSGVRLRVVDKEDAVAKHQTGHNSGVIHSGLYYKPGSLKATLCVSGAAAMTAFCQQHGIPYEMCGKLVTATGEEELAGLEELYRRGVANGVPGLRLVSEKEIREIEPHARGIRGIHVASTGITNYARVAEKYAELVRAAGGIISLATAVQSIRRSQGEIEVGTSKGTLRTKFLVNCAGLYSDRICRLAGFTTDVQIVPFRGEYYELSKKKHPLVHGLIYPVPDPRFPFLGVHFTRRIEGGVEAGPNAVLALRREGYKKTDMSLGESLGMAVFPGFWKMALRYWKDGLQEYHRSLSRKAFVRALQRMVPEVIESDLVAGGSGVRAQALTRQGKLVDDFYFAGGHGMLHVLNVPSPAATASLAIAKVLADRVDFAH